MGKMINVLLNGEACKVSLEQSNRGHSGTNTLTVDVGGRPHEGVCLEGVMRMITDLEKRLDDLSTPQPPLLGAPPAADIAGVIADLQDLKDQILGLETSLGVLTTSSGTNASKITTIENDLAKIEADVVKLEALTAKVTALETGAVSMQTSITGNATELVGVKATTTSNTSRIDALETAMPVPPISTPTITGFQSVVGVSVDRFVFNGKLDSSSFSGDLGTLTTQEGSNVTYTSATKLFKLKAPAGATKGECKIIVRRPCAADKFAWAIGSSTDENLLQQVLENEETGFAVNRTQGEMSFSFSQTNDLFVNGLKIDGYSPNAVALYLSVEFITAWFC